MTIFYFDAEVAFYFAIVIALFILFYLADKVNEWLKSVKNSDEDDVYLKKIHLEELYFLLQEIEAEIEFFEFSDQPGEAVKAKLERNKIKNTIEEIKKSL